jgi:hypothetical protein
MNSTYLSYVVFPLFCIADVYLHGMGMEESRTKQLTIGDDLQAKTEEKNKKKKRKKKKINKTKEMEVE